MERNIFSFGDIVCFDFDNETHVGKVFIIDYRDNVEVPFFGLNNAGYTYDVEVKSENMLYKHLPGHVLSLFERAGGDGTDEV